MTRKRSLTDAAPPGIRSSNAVATKLLSDAGIDCTTTKAGWCLREGLSHLVSVDCGSLQGIIEHSGAPLMYSCRHQEKGDDAVTNMKNPTTCFQSLCRIVAGQQLAGAAAQTVWKRLLDTTHPSLTPQIVLELAEKNITTCLQKPAGLSGAKARSLVDLAQHFERGVLQESFLHTASEENVREALLKVRGLGPWSCDMFLLFYLERPDVLPLGDLGVRKGIAKHFGIQGSGNKGSLCPKKDLKKIENATKAYAPYRSLLSYYMWKVADTTDFYNENSSKDEIRVVTPEKPMASKRAKR